MALIQTQNDELPFEDSDSIREVSTSSVMDSYERRGNPPDTSTPEFSIHTLLFCVPHGSLRKKAGKIIDVTSAIPAPNTLSRKDLVAAAQKTFDQGTQATERYRTEKSGCSSFTLHADSSPTPTAKFRAPVLAWRSITISFPPAARVPHPQPRVALHMRGYCFSRSHAFVYHSRRHEWHFVSGAEIHLHASPPPGAPPGQEPEVRAKFWFLATWFRSRGVLALDRGTAEMGGEAWTDVVVATLLACLRRERELRYALASHGIPMPRSGF